MNYSIDESKAANPVLADSAKSKFRTNVKIGALCLGLAGGMIGVSYAAVPLYRLFCQVTGYGGTTQKADNYQGAVSDAVMQVSFDSNISRELGWSFKPQKREITLRPGEKVTAYYIATNTGDQTTTGTATFNVSPQAAGPYFNKIECFCFTEQTLAPGETAEMPVLFYLDPEIVNDPLLKYTTTITLSYTFYPKEMDKEEDSASLNKQVDPEPEKRSTLLSKLQ